MNVEPIVPETEAILPSTETIKQRKPRGVVAQRLLDNLSLAEHLVVVAQKPGYAPLLSDVGVDAALVASLAQNTAACRAGILHLTDRRGERRTATGGEASSRTQLVNGLQKAQALAKVALTLDPTKAALKDRYLIGTTLRALSRPNLESAADQIIGHLKTDNLKGMTSATLAALEATFATWRTTDDTQTGAHASAITTRAELTERFTEVERQRRAIQLAADAAWPYTNSNNAGVRTEFRLPLTAPLKGA